MRKRANGEGSVYRRKDGRWAASVSLDHGRRKAFYGKTRQEVGRKLGAALKARQDGLPVVGERQTVAKFLESWLESTRPTVRPRTFTRYEEYVRLHVIPELGSLTLARLSPQYLQRLYANRLEAGLSPTSVAHLHAVLHRALEQAARWGLTPRNVAKLVTPPRPSRREMATLSPEQARALLQTAEGDRLEALYVLALSTGMRQGELLALRWRDVELEGGSLQVRATLQRTHDGFQFAEPKTARSRRQVALTRAAADSLRRHRSRQLEERLQMGAAWEDNDLVFANEVGRPIEAGNLIRRSFHPLLQRAALPQVRFHDLRHTAATLALGKGVHPKMVAEMLGHSQIAVTLDLYSHVTPTMQRQAADALEAVLSG
jgi:integrase